MDAELDRLSQLGLPDSYERAAQAVALTARLKGIQSDLDALHLFLPAAHVASAIYTLEQLEF